jgi:4-hydroxybenzoate polyprenyltransferase
VLFLEMLRPRVVTLLLAFFAIPLAVHGAFASFDARVPLGALALACAYVSATTANDLADVRIDRVNLPGVRPLASGRTTRSRMVLLHIAANALAVALGLLAAGVAGAAVMAASVLLNLAYSLPPFRLSWRTHLAHATLALGYVAVPSLLAHAILGMGYPPSDRGLTVGLVVLFWGRIVLKDFRDRRGDAEAGKVTLALRYGKPAVGWASAWAIVAGGALAIVGLGLDSWWSALPCAALLALALAMLARLVHAASHDDEQRAIALGARAGNGFLLCGLAAATLASSGAPPGVQAAALWVVAGLFLANVTGLSRRRGALQLAYR